MESNFPLLAVVFCIFALVNFPAWTMWEVSTLTISDNVTANASHGNMLALGHLETPTISFVDCQLDDGKPLAAVEVDLAGLRIEQSGMSGLAYSPDGAWLAATTLGQLHLIDAQTISHAIKEKKDKIAGTAVFLLPDDDFFSTVAFSNDGSLLVLGSDDGQIWAWRKQANQSFQHVAAIKFSTTFNDIHQIACIDDRRIIITQDNQIAIWEWVGEALVQTQKLFDGKYGIFLITPEGKIGIMSKENYSFFPDELVIYDADETTGDFREYEKISYFNLFPKRLGAVRSCGLDITNNTLVFGLRNFLIGLAQIKDDRRASGVKDIESLKTFHASVARPMTFVAFLTPNQFVAQGERTLNVFSINVVEKQ